MGDDSRVKNSRCRLRLTTQSRPAPIISVGTLNCASIGNEPLGGVVKIEQYVDRNLAENQPIGVVLRSLVAVPSEHV